MLSSHWQTLSQNVVLSTPRLRGIRTHNFSSSDWFFHLSGQFILLDKIWRHIFFFFQKENISTSPTFHWLLELLLRRNLYFHITLPLWVKQMGYGYLNTTLCDKGYQWLAVGLWFSPPIKLTATIYLKYCWKWCQTP
jgi:hypothetical protein